jgi:hypothetical protein
MSIATTTDRSIETNGKSNRLTEALEERLSHPATSPDFDLKKGVNEVLADVGLASAIAVESSVSMDKIQFFQVRCGSGRWLQSVWRQEA